MWLEAYIEAVSFRRIATVEQLQLQQTDRHTYTVSFTVSLVWLYASRQFSASMQQIYCCIEGHNCISRLQLFIAVHMWIENYI